MPKYTEGAMRAAKRIAEAYEKAREYGRFASPHHDDFAEIIDRETAKDRSELVEALQRANEHFQHAPHTRTGSGGVTEHAPENCTRCIIEAALRKAGVL